MAKFKKSLIFCDVVKIVNPWLWHQIQTNEFKTKILPLYEVRWFSYFCSPIYASRCSIFQTLKAWLHSTESFSLLISIESVVAKNLWHKAMPKGEKNGRKEPVVKRIYQNKKSYVKGAQKQKCRKNTLKKIVNN